jgi:hypothetical protein
LKLFVSWFFAKTCSKTLTPIVVLKRHCSIWSKIGPNRNWSKLKIDPKSKLVKSQNWPKLEIGPNRNWSKIEIGPNSKLVQTRNWSKSKLVQTLNWPKFEIGSKSKLVQALNRSKFEIGPKSKLVQNRNWRNKAFSGKWVFDQIRQCHFRRYRKQE